MRDCMLIEGDQQQQLAAAMIAVVSAGKKLADAATEKFGPAGDKLGVGALSREDARSIDSAEQVDSGDTATLKLRPTSKKPPDASTSPSINPTQET